MRRANVELARQLRKDATWAERILWKHLRNRSVGSARFRRQHGIGPYVIDFYCADRLLAIEVDGDVHGEPSQREHDKRRSRYLAQLGIEELRFWNHDVQTNLEGVLETILRSVEKRATPPHLNPLPDGERRPERQ